MALNSIDEVIYDKITYDYNDLSVRKLSEYLSTLVEKIEEQQERIEALESTLESVECEMGRYD